MHTGWQFPNQRHWWPDRRYYGIVTSPLNFVYLLILFIAAASEHICCMYLYHRRQNFIPDDSSLFSTCSSRLSCQTFLSPHALLYRHGIYQKTTNYNDGPVSVSCFLFLARNAWTNSRSHLKVNQWSVLLAMLIICRYSCDAQSNLERGLLCLRFQRHRPSKYFYTSRKRVVDSLM